MKTKIIFVFLFVFSSLVQGQVNYKAGYIVLTNGDTLFTKTKYLPGNEMYHQLYYLDEFGKERKMPVNEVYMYKRDTVEYHNFTGSCFYKLIKCGRINLYAYQKNLETRYGVGAYGNSYTVTNSNVDDGFIYILEKDSLISKTVVNSNMHTIIPFIQDEPEMVKAIEHKTGFINLPSLIESYNKKHLIE